MSFSYAARYVIVGFASVGIAINLGSLIMLMRKRSCTMFHNLLKLLAVSDLCVVCGCALLYGLPLPSFPDLWSLYYDKRIFPIILPYLLPTVQIAMMTSVYCTIVMSFERYVRIGGPISCVRSCGGYITEKNFKYYVFGVVICPMVFYIPKFFELKTVYSPYSIRTVVDCASIIEPAGDLRGLFSDSDNESSFSLGDSPFLSATSLGDSLSVLTEYGLKYDECFNDGNVVTSTGNNGTNVSHPINITKVMTTPLVEPTDLKRNPFYDKIYNVGLNTMFASVIPFLSLFYFNVYTIIALRRIGRENNLAWSSLPVPSGTASTTAAIKSRTAFGSAIGGGGTKKNLNLSGVAETRNNKRTNTIEMSIVRKKKERQPRFDGAEGTPNRKISHYRKKIRMKFTRETTFEVRSMPDNHNGQVSSSAALSASSTGNAKSLDFSPCSVGIVINGVSKWPPQPPAPKQKRRMRNFSGLLSSGGNGPRSSSACSNAYSSTSGATPTNSSMVSKQINVTFLTTSSHKSGGGGGKRSHHSSGGACNNNINNNNSHSSGVSDSLAFHPLLRKRSESECEYSPQARNDFELRRLMELDPSFAGVAGPEEARRRTARRKLRLMMKDPSEEMSGGLARKATKRRYLAKPRTNLRYRSNSAPEEAFMSTSDADTNGDANTNPAAVVAVDDDDDESDCGGEYRYIDGVGGGGDQLAPLAVPVPSMTSASPATVSNGGGYNMVAARAVSQAEGGSFYGSQPGTPYCATAAAAAAAAVGVNGGVHAVTAATMAGSVWRRGERRITRVALSIVWLFLFCHVWKLVLTIYENVRGGEWPDWLRHIHDISHSLIVFNSAVNFLLYTFL